MLRVLKWVLLWAVLVAVAVAGWALWWWQTPLRLKLDASAQVLDVTIAPGSSAAAVARALVAAGVDTPALWLEAGFRLSGQARRIQAGSYELSPGESPQDVLGKLVRGEQALRSVTLVEGWNLRQVLAALASADDLTNDLPNGLTPQFMQRIGWPGVAPEGRFFPDTYRYAKGSPASAVLQQAAQAMRRQLDDAWQQRAPDLPLRSADELLTLASIVEKETGQAADRPLVAGVFVNRLRIGMRLQTDPTVIYGLGERFDGNLRRIHLDTDTPYNTYTRAGLPPTPIAMPGRAALLAAARPASTDALYFVARGDGSSVFSRTLDAHNRAVRQYQLR